MTYEVSRGGTVGTIKGDRMDRILRGSNAFVPWIPTTYHLQVGPDERLVGDLYQKRQVVRPECRRRLPQIAVTVNPFHPYTVQNRAILPSGVFPN